MRCVEEACHYQLELPHSACAVKQQQTPPPEQLSPCQNKDPVPERIIHLTYPIKSSPPTAGRPQTAPAQCDKCLRSGVKHTYTHTHVRTHAHAELERLCAQPATPRSQRQANVDVHQPPPRQKHRNSAKCLQQEGCWFAAWSGSSV